MRQAIALLPGELYSSRFGLPVLPAVLARGNVAWGLAELGDFAEAAGMGEDAVRLGEAAVQPTSMPMRCVCWFGLRRQGDVHTAIPILEQSLAISQTPTS